MSNFVMIVESPEKAKVIFSYLKDKGDWKVFASKGHICDLPEKEYGVTNQNNNFDGAMVFKPHAKEILSAIKAEINPNTQVYIATDDDFEGEKIAQDLVLALKLKEYKRIVFSEISRTAIEHSINNPRELDYAKLNAQKARRLIDRITGYPGSHAIKEDFKNLGLPYDPKGIGRSIAPALKLLCDVEEAKRNFEDNPPEIARMIRARYNVGGAEFIGMLAGAFPKNAFLEMNELINLFSRNQAVVTKVKPNITPASPPKPLTTSSYQYGMFYLFGIKPKRAMEIAQTLYNLGFITYPRTDSFRVPQEKAVSYMDYILEQFGEEYCNDTTRLYSEQVDNGSQNAHPALLPTKVIPTHYPKAIFDFWRSYKGLSILCESDEFLKAYRFIFYRAIASQMASARYSTCVVNIEVAKYMFEAKENYLIFPGWKTLSDIITEASDEDDLSEDYTAEKREKIKFPDVDIGQKIDLVSYFHVDTVPHSPKRYGVGRFVSTLFRLGVVRPSTMDKIVETLEGKGYKPLRAKL